MQKSYQKMFLTLMIAVVLALGFFAFTGGAQAANPKCSNGIDDDGDGKIDFGDGLNNDPDCVSDFGQSENSGHPFLLVTEDMYEGMRTRADQSPWKEMKAEAIVNCLNSDGKTFYSYGDVTQLAIEGVDLNWTDVSGKLINNGWAKRSDPSKSNKVGLTVEPERITGQLQTVFGSNYSIIFPILRDAGTHIYYGKGAPLQRQMNGCSLAYILDPGNKTTYLAQYKQGMSNWVDLKNIAEKIASDDGDSYIIVGSAYIMSMLATDIFYNDLLISNPSLLATYENQYLTRTMGELLSKKNHNRGTKLIWAIYNHHRSPTAENKQIVDDYRQLYLDTFYKDKAGNGGGIETAYASEDGVYAAGTNYGIYRILGAEGHRVGKFGEMDIASFTGHYNFYNDQRFENLFEWMFHFGFTPQKNVFLSSYGDTNIGEGWAARAARGAMLYSMHKWSDELAGHAAWLVKDSGLNTFSESSIFVYVNDNSLPAPIKPKSKVFPDGAAAFWEDNPSDQSLFGNILSMSLTEWHSRNEANSIYIQGYGEHLITNLGSISYNDDNPCKTPNDLKHNRTNSAYNSFFANTVSIEGQKHTTIKPGYSWPEVGKEISEGFVNTLFDYASADSGAALPNGHHQRNFIFIHPEQGKNYGYFVLFDEVNTTRIDAATAQIYLHTVSNALTSINNNLEYKAVPNLPDLISVNEKNAGVSIFLGTPPSANLGAEIKKNDANGVVYVGKPTPTPTNAAAYCRYVDYLQTNYDLNINDSSRKKNIVTILFPSDNTHTKAPMSRITGTNYSGAKISNISVTDYAIESSTANPVTYNDNGLTSNITFQGLASMYRLNNNENEFYFVRQGKEFNDGKTNKKGFTSNNPVSVYLKDKIGKIIVPATGATVTFSYPGITGVKIDGVTKPATTTIAGIDKTKEYAIEILTGPVLNPADVNGDGKVNIKDIQAVIQVINGAETNPEVIGRANVNGDAYVNIKDIQAIIQEIVRPS